MLMGYEKASDEIVVMKQQSSSYDTLVYVACECFIAAVECLLMSQIWEKVDEDKYSIMDVYKSRMEICGDADQCATWVVQHCVSQRRRSSSDRCHNYNSFNSYHHNYGISNSNSSGAKPKSNSHSNSNSVDHHSSNSGILRSHKSKGGSGSPTLTKRSRESRDSGYGSKSASKELPEIVPGRQRSEEIAPEDLYGHGKQVGDNNVAQLGMNMHELHLRDGRTGARLHTDSGLGPEDGVDDVFTAKTMDDHLRETEKYMKGIEKAHSLGSPGHSTLPPRASGTYDEWSDVRDKLRQDFGDRYFEGERGDTILKPNTNAHTIPMHRDGHHQHHHHHHHHHHSEKDKKKNDRRSFQNIDVVRSEVGTSRHSKVEYGTADKYKAPMSVVAEKAKQTEKSQLVQPNDKNAVPIPEMEKETKSATKPSFLRQNSAEEQRRFDNAAMVKDIVAQSSVFKKLAAERSPSEESEGREMMTKSTDSLKSKDVSPTESVHSTVGELIDFSEAKVLHQMGCKFMPELRARPHGPNRLTIEEKLERKERKEKRKKEKERREREKELRGEGNGGEEKTDAGKPVMDGAESYPLEKKPEPNVPTQSEATGGIKHSSSCSATCTSSATKSHIAPPMNNDGGKPDQLSPIAECKENGETCDRGGKVSPSSSKQQIVKKEVLSNDVISNANVVPPSNNTNNNAQQSGGASKGGSQGGSPVHGAAMKGGCIAGHAALTNSTLSSHALGSHSPRCPVHGTPGVPHPLIAIGHPHMPPGHIVMCSAGHAHIAPAHMAAMQQSQYVSTGPKEVPCPKPPPPPVAPKPNNANVKSIDNRRSLDIVASTSSSRTPPTPPPRISSALSSDGHGPSSAGSLSDLPPPPPELLSDIHAPPPDLVSNHTPPSHSARAPNQSPGPPDRGAMGVKSLPATGTLPTEPPSYEAATGMLVRHGNQGPASYPVAMEEPDGLYVVADGPPARALTWQCKTCTFANPASKKVCEMCGKSRMPGPEAAPLLSGGSQCPRCTYVNSIGSLMCKVCMQDLQGSPTYM